MLTLFKGQDIARPSRTPGCKVVPPSLSGLYKVGLPLTMSE